MYVTELVNLSVENNKNWAMWLSTEKIENPENVLKTLSSGTDNKIMDLLFFFFSSKELFNSEGN